MRGGMALRFAARAYALRGDARGLDAVVAGAQALATDRFKGYRQLDEMIAATVKSVGVRVLEERIEASALPSPMIARGTAPS